MRYFRLKLSYDHDRGYHEKEFITLKEAEDAYLYHIFKSPDHYAMLWEYTKIKVTDTSNFENKGEIGHKLIASNNPYYPQNFKKP